jgi:putative ABC transport system ATP-binding protein
MPSPTTPFAVEINDLNHHFGRGESRKQVLYQNRLAIKPGEIVIMTGPSGSGKTTLLTLIGALRAIQEGGIKLWGTELAGLSPVEQVKMRRNIGFIFQAHNLFDALTARQNIKMAIELTDVPAAERDALADATLAALGLAERVNYKPRNLSGGQRQRVAIGRALVNRPRLILADEPTAALDKDSGANVVALLRKLADENGTTVMIVTHDNRILSVADRLVNMIDGNIVSNIRVKENAVICAILKQCTVFKDMSPSDLTDIAQKMEQEDFTPGTDIIRQGEIGDKFYVIAKGRAQIITASTTDVSRPVTLIKEGAFFGEVALLRDQPRNATVRAQESVTTYTLSKENFLAAVRAHKSFEEQLATQLFHRG